MVSLKINCESNRTLIAPDASAQLVPKICLCVSVCVRWPICLANGEKQERVRNVRMDFKLKFDYDSQAIERCISA